MDAATRRPSLRDNPAALMAASWYVAGDGKGKRDMVVLPYRDRLEVFSRYLQQLVMESLGKRLTARAALRIKASRFTETRARPTNTPTFSSCAMASTTSLSPSSRSWKIQPIFRFWRILCRVISSMACRAPVPLLPARSPEHDPDRASVQCHQLGCPDCVV